VLQRAAREGHALLEADEPAARAGSGSAAAATTPARPRLATSTTSGSAPVILTSTLAAGACLRTLVSPSCTMR
jgi:hypothetical protein